MSIIAGTAGYSGLWTNVYIIRTFVEMLKDELTFAKLSEPANIPKNAGGYIARWNIPQRFIGTVTARTEASAGTVGDLTGTTINTAEATISEYYDSMKIGKVSSDSFVDGTLDVFYEQFAFAGASAIDTLLRNAARTGSTSSLSSRGPNGATGVVATGLGTLFSAATDNQNLTVRDFPVIAGYFFGGNCRGFKELRGDFGLIIHPKQETLLVTEFSSSAIGWTDVNQYTETGYGQLFDKMRIVGRFAGLTAMRSTMIQTSTVGSTFAWSAVALAKYGLGWAGLGESGPMAAELIHKTPNEHDTSQPANTYDTLAWKVRAAFKMLDAARVLNVYSYSFQ